MSILQMSCRVSLKNLKKFTDITYGTVAEEFVPGNFKELYWILKKVVHDNLSPYSTENATSRYDGEQVMDQLSRRIL